MYAIILKFFTPSVRLLFKRLGVAFMLFSITRFLFWLVNLSYFKGISPLVFLVGLRFDASVIAYALSVFIVLSVIPFHLEKYKTFRRVQSFFFFIPLAVCVFMNLADMEYYRFIFRRTTIDIVRFFSSPEADGWRLMGQFIRDFWYIGILFVVLMMIAWFCYQKATRSYETSATQQDGWKVKTTWFVLMIGLLILAGRGGFQLTPISLVDAGFGKSPKNISMVLNTPFSVMITAFQQHEDPVYYFSSREESEKHFTPNYTVKPFEQSFKGRNIVVLILESFGKEYIGFYNDKKGYTPFLDSLLDQSYVFPNSFANGKQSIDAVPSIIGGIPAMMQDPFTYSVYSGNRINTLASYFKKEGYVSQFFHGGSNGTMGFEAFCDYAGVDQYFGKDEYPDVKKDYDGNWGIFDEPYLKYCVQTLSKNDKPFLSFIFTLSSHHPYTIPEKYKWKFPKGKYEIHESIGYADYALSQFFKEAQQQPWYKNTLFVITADHTAHSDIAFYQNGIGMYAAPIAFYDPQQLIKGIDSTIVQHIDLFPTLISLTGGKHEGKFFGRNMFDKQTTHSVLNYNYGTYYYLTTEGGKQLFFDGQKITGVYDYPADSSLKNNEQGSVAPWLQVQEPIVKARIQSYFQNMEENTFYVE